MELEFFQWIGGGGKVSDRGTFVSMGSGLEETIGGDWIAMSLESLAGPSVSKVSFFMFGLDPVSAEDSK